MVGFLNVEKEIRSEFLIFFRLVLPQDHSYFSYIPRPQKYLILLNQYREKCEILSPKNF